MHLLPLYVSSRKNLSPTFNSAYRFLLILFLSHIHTMNAMSNNNISPIKKTIPKSIITPPLLYKGHQLVPVYQN
jgi:hypothetical protein